jgi:RNA polymerase sigma factor (sigma-70 family)
MSDDRFESLCERYREPLVRYLMRFGRQKQEAEDIAHEALLKVRNRIEGVKHGSEWTYLRVTASHLAQNEHRRANAAKRGGMDVHVPFETVLENAADETHDFENRAIARVELARLQRQVSDVMNRLTRDTQLAIVLRRRGYRSKEIAIKLGLSATDVRSKLHRATELFRARLGEPPASVAWLDLAGDDE